MPAWGRHPVVRDGRPRYSRGAVGDLHSTSSDPADTIKRADGGASRIAAARCIASIDFTAVGPAKFVTTYLSLLKPYNLPRATLGCRKRGTAPRGGVYSPKPSDLLTFS